MTLKLLLTAEFGKSMIFEQEKIMIYHPGKCGGSTIEQLFIKPLYGVGAASLWADPCLQHNYDYQLTKECLNRRLSCMTGFLARKYEVNGIGNLYLQHADIYASLEIHEADYLYSLFKVVKKVPEGLKINPSGTISYAGR